MARPDMWSDDPVNCPKCDTPHARESGKPTCAGHNRAGESCKNGPLPGQKVCRMHGGRSPQAQAAAERRQGEARARRALESFGAPAEGVADPGSVLVGLIEVSSGLVDFYREQIRDLEPGALVWGVTKTKTETAGGMGLTFGGREVDGEDTVGLVDFGSVPASEVESKAAVSMWLRLFSEERDRLANLAVAALRAGVAERQIQLAEQQGQVVAAAIRAILADLGLSPAQEVLVVEVVPRHLRALSAQA